MSETSRPHSPEAPAPEPHIEGVPDGLQLPALDAIVGLRATLEAEYNSQTTHSQTLDAYIQQGIEARLQQNGITEGDSDETRDEYATAIDIYRHVASFDEASWLLPISKGKRTPREEAFKEIEKWHQQREEKAEKEAIDAGLGEIRERYAELLVGRTRKIFEFGHQRIEGKHGVDQIGRLKNIDQAREEFGDYLSAMATQMAEEFELAKLDPANESDKTQRDVIAHEIDKFIKEQTELFISTFEEMRADVYKERSGIIKWGLDKWASWSADQDPSQTFWQRITSKENLKNNLKKGVLLGGAGFLAGAAAGAIAAPFMATVGAGAVAGLGIGAWITRGLARNVATHKLDAAANSVTIAEKQAQDFRLQRDTLTAQYDEVMQYKDADLKDVDLDSFKDSFDTDEEFQEFKARVEQARTELKGAAAHEAILGLIDDRTKFYRRQNTTRFMAGTAISVVSGALGAVVGGLVSHQIGSALHMGGGHNITATPKPSSSAQPSAGASAVPTPSPTVTSASPSTSPTASPGATPNPGGSPAPGTDNPGGPKSPGSHELLTFKILGSDERTLSRGEGWYQTFREMGVSAKHRTELLNEVGPYLKEKGLAYWDSNADEWRMNMTENGKLPTSAIRHIAETAHEHGWQSDYDKFFEPVSDNSMSDTAHENIAEYAKGRDESVIAPGEGGHEFMRELGIKDPQDRQAVWNEIAPQLNDDKLTYYDKQNSDWRLNMTPDGKMPTSAIETAVETAQAKGINTDYTSIVEAGNHLSANNSFTANQLTTGYNRDMKAYYDVLKNVDPRHRADVLSIAAHDLQSFKLTEKVDGVWRFREISSLPPKAGDLLSRIADKHNWTLAA